MIWWIAGVAVVGLLMIGVVVWYSRQRLVRLVESAAELARAEADLEYRRKNDSEREDRFQADSAADIRKREQELLEEASHVGARSFGDCINRRS